MLNFEVCRRLTNLARPQYAKFLRNPFGASRGKPRGIASNKLPRAQSAAIV